MSITAFILYKFTNIPGVVVGASALSTAVICEAIASKLMVKKFLVKLKSQGSATQSELTIKEIVNFITRLRLHLC